MKQLIIILALALNMNVFAQDADKTVTLVVSGQGKTQDEAKQVALRSAIEQAFGTFISSKTEILNDQVVSDQIASVANGNIQSFTILNESQLPNGTWGVTLKAIVSVDKLTSFVEAKGVAIEMKGGMFAMNIKQQLLNEQGEIKAVSEMVGLLHEPMQISFDYTIKSSDPKSLDAESKNWEIPLEVTATANKNMDFCANYCFKTLAALSLSSEEVTSYQSLNKAVFRVVINYNGVANTFYLRKESSINALKTFTSNWEFYTRLFTVQSGMEVSNGNGEGRIQERKLREEQERKLAQQRKEREEQERKASKMQEAKRIEREKELAIEKEKQEALEKKLAKEKKQQEEKYRNLLAEKQRQAEYQRRLTEDKKKREIHDFRSSRNFKDVGTIINFLTTGQQAATFSWQDKRTLSQIEQMTGYKVKPRGVVSKFKHGGFVVFEENGHGLVASITDLGEMDWNSAKTACEELILNGYSDWHLPSKEELNSVYVNLKQVGVGGFASKDYSYYWSSTEDGDDNGWGFTFDDGDVYYYSKTSTNYVRAVRAF